MEFSLPCNSKPAFKSIIISIKLLLLLLLLELLLVEFVLLFWLLIRFKLFNKLLLLFVELLLLLIFALIRFNILFLNPPVDVGCWYPFILAVGVFDEFIIFWNICWLLLLLPGLLCRLFIYCCCCCCCCCWICYCLVCCSYKRLICLWFCWFLYELELVFKLLLLLLILEFLCKTGLL